MKALAVLLAFVFALPQGRGEVERAERAYRTGDYAAAAAGYQRAIAAGDSATAALQHNLGNCAFRTGHFVEAALCYRRALLHKPDDAASRHNLELAERRLGLDPARADAEPWRPRVLAWLLPAALLQTLGLLALLAPSRARRFSGLLLLLAGTLAAGLAALRQWGPAPVHAVVLAPTTLRASAAATAAPLRAVAAGEVVHLVADTGGAVRVAIGSVEGWLDVAALGIVE